MADLAVVQMVGDDAGHLAARLEGGIGQETHQADPAAAIDQADLVLAQEAAEPNRRRAIGLGDLAGGAAIDAEALHRRHFLFLLSIPPNFRRAARSMNRSRVPVQVSADLTPTPPPRPCSRLGR